MKTIKFVGYLLYRYYSKGIYSGIFYLRALYTLSFLAFMHLIQIVILLDDLGLVSIKPTEHKIAKRIILFLAIIPIFLLIKQIFKEKDIEKLKEKYSNNPKKISAGNVWLVVYIILSLLSTLALAFWVKRWLHS